MSFKIETGLFLLDEFTDCHAILGVSVEADAKVIRKRYLKVAQRLHPDSFIDSSESDKQLATQLFSKLVGPAYNTLCKDRERKEYLLLIGLKGKQAIQQRTSISKFCDLAKELGNSNNLQEDYEKAVSSLGEIQFNDLSKSFEITGRLSELNLVYLMRREAADQKILPTRSATTPSTSATTSSTTSPPPSSGPTSSSSSSSSINNTPPPPAPKPSIVEGYLRRAEEYMGKNAYAQAILELRDALNIDPKDSRCHSLMGMIYLNQNQLTMAKVSIKRALELNPQDATALKGKAQLERLGQSLESKGSSAKKPQAKSSGGKDVKKGGGLFGGLFGGKKK
ncbi:MAG: DnaJ domain-containing protein [Prochlorotrichaceae cyanobacterium]|jgi:curved DNA-binding protein CbpA